VAGRSSLVGFRVNGRVLAGLRVGFVWLGGDLGGR
jgi:hypothetical protein